MSLPPYKKPMYLASQNGPPDITMWIMGYTCQKLLCHVTNFNKVLYHSLEIPEFSGMVGLQYTPYKFAIMN